MSVGSFWLYCPETPKLFITAGRGLWSFICVTWPFSHRSSFHVLSVFSKLSLPKRHCCYFIILNWKRGIEIKIREELRKSNGAGGWTYERKIPVEFERAFPLVIYNTASGDSCSLYLKQFLKFKAFLLRRD
jgi:hypothetical protein